MCGVCLLTCTSSLSAQPRHGISAFGELHYPPDFRHFDYVNPDAPKGGELRLPGFGTFDSLHPFIRKGRAAEGADLYRNYIYDRLTARAKDDPSARYGLLAETIERAKDGSWVEFVLRKEARWHDGNPVTADDLLFTFNTLRTKGTPLLKMYLMRVAKAEKRGPRTVRFLLRNPRDIRLPLSLADLMVLPKHYWEKRDFERTTLEPPLTSGPYRVSSVEPGRKVVFERVKNYWGEHLPVNVGRHNFDTIVRDFFQDNDVRLEALKAGELDFALETVSKTWASGYDFPARKQGHFVLETIKTEAPATMRLLLFNTRLPKFRDRRVRKALVYTFDREWKNRVQTHGVYVSSDSHFARSELAQRGAPSATERSLLEPFRDQLPKELFEREFKIPRTSGKGRNRDNLRVAMRLLREAGYRVREGQLVDGKTGKPFTIDIMLDAATRTRMTLLYANALERLGIQVTMRVVDTSQLFNRRRSFDFEMLYGYFRGRTMPGTELRSYFNSKAADSPNTLNYAGVKNPVVDAMIERVIASRSHTELVTASRALDRVLLWGYYGIDLGHTKGWNYAYWNRFGHPPKHPRFEPGFPHAWWIDPAKDARTREAMGR